MFSPRRRSEEGVCSHLTGSGPSAQGAGVGVGTDGNHPPPGPLQSSHSLLFSECLVYCSAFVKRGIG